MMQSKVLERIDAILCRDCSKIVDLQYDDVNEISNGSIYFLCLDNNYMCMNCLSVYTNKKQFYMHVCSCFSLTEVDRHVLYQLL